MKASSWIVPVVFATLFAAGRSVAVPALKHSEVALRSDEKAIESVQSFLRSKERTPTLVVNGVWDMATQDALSEYLEHLQREPLFGLSWSGDHTGVYSPQYSRFLRKAITAGEKQNATADYIARFDEFITNMDQLRRDGVYRSSGSLRKSRLAQETVNSGVVENGSLLKPLALEFANGTLSGFGDEIFCAGFEWGSFAECHEESKTSLETVEAQHRYVALGVNLAGAAVNVFSSILSLIAIETNCTGALVLGLSFAMGLVDFLLFAAGDAWTANQAFSTGIITAEIKENWGPLLVMSALSGFVMMWAIALHRWKYKVHPIGATSSFESFWG